MHMEALVQAEQFVITEQTEQTLLESKKYPLSHPVQSVTLVQAEQLDITEQFKQFPLTGVTPAAEQVWQVPFKLHAEQFVSVQAVHNPFKI